MIENKRREEPTVEAKISVAYEYGTLEENIRAYPRYVKDRNTKKLVSKIQEKQDAEKNHKFFIVKRVELYAFDFENKYYKGIFNEKTLSPNSSLVLEIATIMSKKTEYSPTEYIEIFYNK